MNDEYCIEPFMDVPAAAKGDRIGEPKRVHRSANQVRIAKDLLPEAPIQLDHIVIGEITLDGGRGAKDIFNCGSRYNVEIVFVEVIQLWCQVSRHSAV